MKVILFLAAVYSLIINQCYQKNTAETSFPPKDTIAVAWKVSDSSKPAAVATLLYNTPEEKTYDIPGFSMVGSAVKAY